MSNKVIKILFLAFGAVAVIFLNYLFIEHILIPDPCYYHGRDTSFLFDLFYDMPSVNGGHPFPSLVNLIFTIAAGLLVGWSANKFFIRKHQAAIYNDPTLL